MTCLINSSFDNLYKYIEIANQQMTNSYAKVLVSCKADLHTQREVSYEMGVKFAYKNGFDFFIEVSNKTGQNINKLFEQMITLIVHNRSN